MKPYLARVCHNADSVEKDIKNNELISKLNKQKYKLKLELVATLFLEKVFDLFSKKEDSFIKRYRQNWKEQLKYIELYNRIVSAYRSDNILEIENILRSVDIKNLLDNLKKILWKRYVDHFKLYILPNIDEE